MRTDDTIHIMFVCHGNICRSPMAEFIIKALVKERGAERHVSVCSAATSTEEIGNPVYPPAKAELARHGLSCKGKRAVQVRAADYDLYDLFIVMDDYNVHNIMRIFRTDPQGKVRKLMSYTGTDDVVSDPWYTGDFERAYRDIERGCIALLDDLGI